MGALWLCLALAAPAAAGTIWDRVTETTLPNGLKVLLVEEPKAPVVTVQIWYKAGARNEPLGKGGLAHMMEHLMFKGTPKTGPKQFSIIVQRNGGQDNAHTARDAAAYYVDFAADRVNLGLN
jgi:zinc protease